VENEKLESDPTYVARLRAKLERWIGTDDGDAEDAATEF
jgi:hypothetical protein